MWILQWYILRDLLKAMVLTAIGLTLVFTLGGGVANMVKGVTISSMELLELLGFMLPVATTLTLPVASLLSTTNVYGRLSADNEFVACRASGINIHRLLFPAILIAIIVGSFTFYFHNFVIPSFIRQIEAMASGSIDQYVHRELEMNKHLKVQDYAFHADDVQYIPGENRRERGYLKIQGAAFIELEGEDAALFGTSPRAVIEFDKTGRLPKVRALMYNVSMFDRTRLQYGQLAVQPIGPIEAPLPIEMKAKWLDLPELLYYRHRPHELPELVGVIRDLRQRIIRRVVYDDIIESLRAGRPWRIGDDELTYTLQPGCAFMRTKKEGLPRLQDATIIAESSEEGLTTYEAKYGAIRVDRAFGDADPSVIVTLEDGISVQREGDSTVEKMKLELRSIRVPDRYIQTADEYTSQVIHNPRATLGLGPRLEDVRISLYRELGEQARRVIAIIHARAAFSISCIVLILLGAVLGIVFRGGQALVSFGLSCIPFAVVVVTIIMGRQLSHNETTHVAGLIVIWTGIGLVIIADGLMLFRWLRR